MNLVGSPIDFLIAFAAGTAVSFSPCVYPLLPITVGYVGALSCGTRAKGFLITVVYALGVAITYSILGAVASFTGSVFGRIAGTPWPYLVVGNACLFFGLVFFDVFQLPSFYKGPVKIQPKGYIAILLFGMVSGLAVSPCTVPVLGSILVYVGTKQDSVYGMGLLFCFAFGVCATIILAGTFSGLLSKLPRSGNWLNRVKKIYGVVLIGTGEYFLIQAGRYMLS